MSIIVIKFGGTSVADITRIKHVAEKVKALHDQTNKVLVVVSAMAGVTNKLVEYCTEVSNLETIENLKEYDAVVSSGEVVTAALLALALQNIDIKSSSFQAWQLPLSTNNSYSKALIEEINCTAIYKCFEQNIIPIVAGFQGVDEFGHITTLGRGGSDTTAVALAAALQAERCDIYTDVEGVFTSDPRMVPTAKKINYLTYEEMLEFASLGAKVIHQRSVQIAMRYSIPLRILSTFKEGSGTLITTKEEIIEINKNMSEEIMETAKITAIAYNHNIALITIKGVKNYPADFAEIYDYLVNNGTHIDTIIHNFSAGEELHNIIFTIPLIDISKINNFKTLNNFHDLYKTIDINSDIVIISIIGHGIKTDPNLALKAFEIISKAKRKIYATFNADTKLSVIFENINPEIIVKDLHAEFIQ